MAVPVTEVDLGLAQVPTAVNRVPRSSEIVVKPDYVDKDIVPLLYLMAVDRTNKIHASSPCSAKSLSEYGSGR